MVIRVSRHGMTRCTSCDRHIRLEAVVSETRCPFCGGVLTAPGPIGGALGRTGGALAASLISFGIGAGCLDDNGRPSSDTNDASETSVQDVADTTDTSLEPDSIQPLYGLPMDTAVETAEDSTPQPEYGLPMDTSEADAADSGDDVPFVPLYGQPPSDTIETADDSTPQPEYGLPMEDVMEDSGDVGPSDAKDDADDADGETDGGAVPLYGLPPG
jgi:hypothetical protein